MPFRLLPTRPRRVLAGGAILLTVAVGAFSIVHGRAGSASDDCSSVPFVDSAAEAMANVHGVPPPADRVNPDALVAAVDAATQDRRQWFVGQFHQGPVVHIGFTHDVEGARREINAKVPDAADVIVYSAPYTEAEVTDGMRAVEAFAAQAHIPFNSLADDTFRDRITVSITDPTAAEVQQLHNQFGCIVNVVKGGPASNL